MKLPSLLIGQIDRNPSLTDLDVARLFCVTG